MKFFRKTSVAVLLTLLIIALCCVIGYTRAAPNTPQDISDAPAQQAGESGLNYYLSWIDDNAGLFSMDTTDTLGKVDIVATVSGGGVTGQAGAIRHGISRALLEMNAEFRPVLKAAGFLTRDPRMKERKKYGLKAARRAPQFSKR